MIELISAIAVMFATVGAAGLWVRSRGRRHQEGGDG